MLETLRRQNPRKIIIMIYNVFRMAFLKLGKPRKVKVSFLQNIHPTTEIDVGRGNLFLSHSIFTRKNVSIRAEAGELKIGTSFFNQGCVVTALQKIIIGDACLFGPNVVIVDHDHDFSYLDSRRGLAYKKSDIIIGNNVWVGANAIILRGTTIGDNCVIAAGCVVSGKIPSNCIVKRKENSFKIEKIVCNAMTENTIE